MIHGKRALMPCDCLNECGDNPRIDSGEVEPCESYKTRKAHCEQIARDQAEERAILAALGFKTALQALRHLAAMMRAAERRNL